MPIAAWTRWRGLSAADRRATLAAAALIPLVHAAVRLLGARRAHQIFAGADTQISTPRDENVSARGIAGAVERAARRGLYAGDCLSRSITVLYLLARRGIRAELRVGTRTDAGKLEAHAWVEHQGLPLNDSPTVMQRFAPFEATPFFRRRP